MSFLIKLIMFILKKCFPDLNLIGHVKEGLSPSNKFISIFFNKSPLKMMKNAFYFILKALFVLKIFKFLS